jgi:prepilin-type N-terminal cleavage/methylation domain-containing protein
MGKTARGFTLIELSIVLVIIGLIVGGVLVGQNLIAAAEVRAQISQIEKYNTAANTFYGKYGYLPGDIKDPEASSFGFQARGGGAQGEGDGNGVLEGIGTNAPPGQNEDAGETVMFWVDLGKAGLIDTVLNTASATTPPSSSIANIAAYLPSAKAGHNGYVYVWSWNGSNYISVSAVTVLSKNFGNISSGYGLTVAQAYGIDSKVDDGMPTSGAVQAWFLNNGNVSWGGINSSTPPIVPPFWATTQTATSCFDNGGVNSVVNTYSVGKNGGSGVNCTLTFKLQAGDQ